MTNTAPVANSFEETGGEDTSVVITPSFFDFDSSDTHSFTVDTTGTVGSVAINDDGTISYDPNGQFEYLAAYAGDMEDETTTAYDSFTYTVTDSSGASSTATVTVRILGQNDGPVAVATSETTDEESSVTIIPEFSDIDTSDTHSFSVDTSETAGTVTVNDDGTFSYDPNGQFEYLAVGETATDSFTYTVTDATGESSTETVTITITGQNDAPVAAAVEATVSEGGTVSIDNGVSDTDTSDVHLIGVNNAETQGTVLVNSDGTFTYDTNGQFNHLGAGETATDSFVYMALDGSWSGASATVTVTITGANDAPVAAEISSTTDEDSSITIAPSYSDADTSDTHSFSVDTTKTLGSVIVNDDGTFAYNPQGQFDGLTAGESAADTFTYTVTDSSGASSTETVMITISGVNDAPVVEDIAATTSEAESVLIEPVFSDAEISDTHTITVDASETTGEVTLVDGSFQYNPNGQFEHLAVGESTIDTFTYTVDDGNGGVVTKTVTMTITGANDAPVASTVASSTNEDSSVVITPSYSDADTSDTHSFSVDATNTLGSVTVNDDDTFSYDPANLVGSLGLGESITDTFTYTVTDSLGESSVATASVIVAGDSEIRTGSMGDDTYLIQASSGSTMIDYTTEVDDGGYDTVVFEDLSLLDLTFTTVEHDDDNGTALKLSWDVDGSRPAGQLQIANMGKHIERFEFADGTTLSKIEVLNDGRVELTGTDGDDKITAGDLAELINGGEGSDTVRYFDATTSVTVNLADQSQNSGDATGDTYASIENIIGSDTHADHLTGDENHNKIWGYGGNDQLYGGAGNDYFYGGEGADYIDGGTGLDFARYSTSDAAVHVNLATGLFDGGHATGDVLVGIENVEGSDFDDVLIGDDNANALYGLDGDDRLYGGKGNDTLNASGSGADYIDGGEGTDAVRYRWSHAAVTVNLADQSQNAGDAAGDEYISIENIMGTDAYGDTLTGDAGDNRIWGYGGDDILTGAGGSDRLYGEGGSDRLYGGEGNDELFGGEGADYLDGGAGSDLTDYRASDAGVTINLAEDTASGGHATGDILVNIENIGGSQFDDVLIGDDNRNNLYAKDGIDHLEGRGGNDTLNAYGSGADYLDGGSGNDTVRYYHSNSGVTVNLGDTSQNTGDASGDTYISIENIVGTYVYADKLVGDDNDNKISGYGGADTLDGGAGWDTLDYYNSPAGVSVNLTTGEVSGGHAEGDVIANFENVHGTHHNDVLLGDEINNVLYANNGLDHLEGRGGNDTLNAYGTGADYLDGGLGTDTVRYRWSKDAVTVNLADPSQNQGDAAGDTYISIENIMGSDAYGDHLTGDAGNNKINGYGGADTLDGGAGWDILDYYHSPSGVSVNLTTGEVSGGHAEGDDIANFENVAGSNHSDIILGDELNNSLVALNGNDHLEGRGGNDTLNAYGSGADYLDGGSGNDTVRYYHSYTSVTVNLGDASQNQGDAAGDTYVSIENVMGSDAYGDYLTGDAAANILDGLGGNDTLTGGAGSDTFVFDGSVFGKDVITDFQSGMGSDDHIRFDADVFADFEAVIAAASDDGINTVIDLDEHNSITLYGTLISDLHMEDFMFV
ncbi:Ig-like domain-containing protein [Pseudovibrio sp. Ad37]|uniref:Ig-like domain-containing protein n=1 Tax=Pseudovibrio sp. Ad37 TaxID=989422 RepID=UPI0007AE6259|nr:Ig-like domain-containing protein [Pseudovibrio sp. Ad37]